MARVTYGVMITELAGSIGGVTFQKNSSGSIARLKPRMPVNPSQLQSDEENALGQLVTLWPTLSAAEKTSWDDLAAAHNKFTPWGEEKTLNGFQWFMSCNRYLVLAGDSILETAPAYASVTPPTAFTLTADADSLDLVWAAPFSVIPDHLFIYLTLPIRHASLKLRRSMYLVDVNDTLNAASLDITTLFETLTNLDWATFYAASEANIIARLITVEADTGMASQFTASLVKIG
jgi:hypothetical protein